MAEQDQPQPQSGSISAEVVAANARLMAMRAARGVVPRPAVDPAINLTQLDPGEIVCAQTISPAVDWQLRNAIALQDDRRAALAKARGQWRPWAADRASQDGPGAAQRGGDGKFYGDAPQNGPQGQNGGGAGPSEGVAVNRASVRIAPDLILYAAQCGDFAAARLYSVIAALDPAGRRLVLYDDVAPLLTDKQSEWYLYGRRRLLSVLRQGEGVYWSREKDRGGRVRLRLISRARIVAHYGITLTGYEVLIPVGFLLSDVRDHGRAREAAALAAVYAAAHAGRRGNDKPIARAKIKESTGLSRWRQRRYERRRGIASRKQITIDGDFSEHRLAALRQRRIASWRHVDRRGLYGRRGAEYIGQQLPNTYQTGSQYVRVNSTRQRRRINAQAARLSDLRGAGRVPVVRVFYEDPKQAGRAASKEIGREDARPVYARQSGRVPVRIGVWRDVARAEYSRYLMPSQLQKWGVI